MNVEEPLMRKVRSILEREMEKACFVIRTDGTTSSNFSCKYADENGKLFNFIEIYGRKNGPRGVDKSLKGPQIRINILKGSPEYSAYLKHCAYTHTEKDEPEHTLNFSFYVLEENIDKVLTALCNARHL